MKNFPVQPKAIQRFPHCDCFSILHAIALGKRKMTEIVNKADPPQKVITKDEEKRRESFAPLSKCGLTLAMCKLATEKISSCFIAKNPHSSKSITTLGVSPPLSSLSNRTDAETHRSTGTKARIDFPIISCLPSGTTELKPFFVHPCVWASWRALSPSLLRFSEMGM